MGWLKLDDNFTDHPKIAPLSDRAFRLHVRALCFCARHMTDGFVSDRQAREIVGESFGTFSQLTGTLDPGPGFPTWARERALSFDLPDRSSSGPNPGSFRAESGGQNLWERVDGGWRIHDYLDYNPSKSEVLARRNAQNQRQQSRRKRKAMSRRDSRVTPGRVFSSLTNTLFPCSIEQTLPTQRDTVKNGNGTRARDLEFAEIYRDYPRKTHREAGLKAWRRLGVADCNAARDALAHHCEFWRASGTPKPKIPAISTWLNGRRWEDELPIDSPQTAQDIEAILAEGFSHGRPT